MLARGEMLVKNCSGFLRETVRQYTLDMKLQGCLSCHVLCSRFLPTCFVEPYAKLGSVCRSSSGFIPHSPTVAHSCGVPFMQIVCEVCVLSLLCLVFTETLSVHLLLAGRSCKVIVAGNWECEIAYLQTSKRQF